MTLLEMTASAAKRIWRRPSVAVGVCVTLGVGLGLATSLYAIVDTVLWQPLPIHAPHRVVRVETLDGGVPDGSSPGLWFVWRERARSVESIAAARRVTATIDDEHGVDRLPGAMVSAAYFAVLATPALHGQAFGPELDRPGSDRVVVLSHRLWEQRYRGDAGIIGRSLTMNGAPRIVIGVMPPTIDEVVEDEQWWMPLALPDSQRTNIGTTYLEMIARLAPVTTAATARDELAALARSVNATAADGSPRGVLLTPLGARAADTQRPSLLLLFGAVLVLLAIACANLANLLLADGLQRRGEMTVRTSLGASRARLMGDLLLEVLLVALAASLLGLILAQWLVDALVVLLPADTPRLAQVRIDARAALFAVMAGLAAALAGGMLPAIRTARTGLSDVLRSRAGSTASGSLRLRRLFVATQVALTMGLAASGALLLRSAVALERAPRGYDASVVTASFALSAPAGGDAAVLVDAVLQSVSTLPTVARAAVATRVPLAGSGAGSAVARLDEVFEARADRQARIRLVSPGYFATMGIPVIHGREIDARDQRDSRPVVMVNQTLARRLGLDEEIAEPSIKFALSEFNPRGRTRPWAVIGIVGDSFDRGPRSTVEPEVFIAIAQAPPVVLQWMGSQAMLAVRGTEETTRLASSLRASLARSSLKVPLSDVRSGDDRLGAHLARERVVSQVLLLLTAGGLSLCALGVFAVVQQIVRGQRQELTLRLALGAAPRRLLTSVVREAGVMVGVGLVLGSVLFWAFSGALRPLLFGVTTLDPITLMLVAAVLTLVAIGAAYMPARAAARLNPATLLREG